MPDHGPYLPKFPIYPHKPAYLELSPLLPRLHPSQDDAVNIKIMTAFRARFRPSLRAHLGKWAFAASRTCSKPLKLDAGICFCGKLRRYNPCYRCIASSRHICRWAIIQVVRYRSLRPTSDRPLILTPNLTSHGCSCRDILVALLRPAT